jgi:hypothetical protein
MLGLSGRKPAAEVVKGWRATSLRFIHMASVKCSFLRTNRGFRCLRPADPTVPRGGQSRDAKVRCLWGPSTKCARLKRSTVHFGCDIDGWGSAENTSQRLPQRAPLLDPIKDRNVSLGPFGWRFVYQSRPVDAPVTSSSCPNVACTVSRRLSMSQNRWLVEVSP